jgi:uncharacterized protein (DUF1684 family)
MIPQPSPNRTRMLLLARKALFGMSTVLSAVSVRAAADAASEQASVEQWRAKRLANLTSDTGWLTLAGLFWLKDGENTFGSAASNSLRLQNPALAATAGSFVKSGDKVRFVARPRGGVTHDGKPVTTIDLAPDSESEPTVLESGPLSFFVIRRGDRFGVRLRDQQNPHRTNFRGLEHFPTSTDWVFDARFDPYEPHRQVRITNILGMEEDMDSPGALVFSKDGKEWRLDAVFEEPGAEDLFVMFADATSGKETYGAGRFMHVMLPENGHVRLDFNEAYNPPCAFNDFATCPLPPFQNRLALRVEAGEKSYGGSQHLSSK